MRKLGLPQKTWEWHELMAQSFSLSPTKSKSSFQSFTSTQVVTASLALGWLKDPPNSWSHSLPAKGKERLGQNTGAHTGSQTHFISAPHASGWLLSLAPSLVTPLHTPPCLSVFSSTHYLHLRFDFRTPPNPFFFHLKVIAIPGAFILDDVVVVRWSTCSSQSAVDLNAGKSQQWALRRVSGINLVFKQPGCIPDFRDTSLCGRLVGVFCLLFLFLGPGRGWKWRGVCIRLGW